MKELANLMLMLTAIIISCIGFSTTKAKTSWSIIIAIQTVVMFVFYFTDF